MKVSILVRAIAAAAVAAAFAPAASAQSLSGDVEVKVNLTSKCRVKAGGPAVVDFGVYQAFGAVVNAPTSTVTFQCTRSFGGTPTATWDAVGGTAAGVGVIEGLQYTLSVTAGARTGGTAASVTTTGTPDEVAYTVGGTMPAGQAGTGAGGTVQTATRTLLVTF